MLSIQEKVDTKFYLIDELACLIFLLLSTFIDAASFSLVAASLFIFLDSTSMDFVSASTFFMSIWQEFYLRQSVLIIEKERSREEMSIVYLYFFIFNI